MAHFNPAVMPKEDKIDLSILTSDSNCKCFKKWDDVISLIRTKCSVGGAVVHDISSTGDHDDYHSKFLCVSIAYDNKFKIKLLIYKPKVYLVGFGKDVDGRDVWKFCWCFRATTLHNPASGEIDPHFILNYVEFPASVGIAELIRSVKTLNHIDMDFKKALATMIIMFCEPTRLQDFRVRLGCQMATGNSYDINDSVKRLFKNYGHLCEVLVLGVQEGIPWEELSRKKPFLQQFELEDLNACCKLIGLLIPVKDKVDQFMKKRQVKTNNKDGKGKGGERRGDGGSGSGGEGGRGHGRGGKGGGGGEGGRGHGRGGKGGGRGGGGGGKRSGRCSGMRSGSCFGMRCMALTSIYVEIERSWLFETVAKIRDEQGLIDEAPDLMQKLVVLLICDHKDYVPAHICCRELSPRAFDIGPSIEKMKPKEGDAVVKEAPADIPLLPNLKCIYHDFIICEDILNPSVPMALRLSGILMGGVVIVYERKVKIFYDDVNRLLVEINSAWKVKPGVDPTLLPKVKKKAKFEALTLPENHDANDLNDVEQTIDSSNKFPSSATFHQSAFFDMRLDTIDELSESFREKKPNEGLHQADPANITLDDPFDSYQADTSIFNRFERFDIEGDEETQINFPSHRGTDIPPAPAPPDTRPQKDDDIKNFSTEDDIPGQYVEDQANLSFPQPREASQQPDQPQQHLHKQKTVRRKARQPPFIMDMEQTVIPSNMYQTWLQVSVDVRAKRPTIIEHVKKKSSVKLAQRVDLPPVALSCGLVGTLRRYQEVHYPQPLLDLWMTCMQPLQDSPSGRTTSPDPPEPSSSLPTHGQGYQDPPNIPMGGFGNGFTSERLASEERIRTDLERGTKVPITEFNTVNNNGMGTTTEPYASAGNSGTSVRSFSVPSPVLGPNLSNTSYSYPGRYNKRHNDCFVICRCYKCIYEIPSVREDPEQWIPILRNICWYLALGSHVPMQSSIMNSTLEDWSVQDP